MYFILSRKNYGIIQKHSIMYMYFLMRNNVTLIFPLISVTVNNAKRVK